MWKCNQSAEKTKEHRRSIPRILAADIVIGYPYERQERQPRHAQLPSRFQRRQPSPKGCDKTVGLAAYRKVVHYLDYARDLRVLRRERLQQMRQALADGVPPAVTLADPAYGNNRGFRAGITELGLAYAVGIMPTTTVWRPGEPLPPQSSSGRGRRAIRQRSDKRLQPVSVKALALQLPLDAWQQISWRMGSNTVLASRFARLRVRVAHGAAEEWLLIEWPDGEAEPDHYWLATLEADITFERLVDLTKLRWRIERDYLELKQEVGLDHYEGRGWRGFHHHASLCIAAYGFLVSETETIPPSGHPSSWCRPRSAVPAGYRPRGAAATLAAPCAELHRHSAHPPRTLPAARTATLSMLRTNASAHGQAD